MNMGDVKMLNSYRYSGMNSFSRIRDEIELQKYPEGNFSPGVKLLEGFNYTETTRNTAGDVVHTTYIDISGNTVKEVDGEASTHYTYDKSGNAYATYMTDAEGTKSMLTLSLCDAESFYCG